VEIAKRGKPSLTVCSAAFAALGRNQARSFGYPELPLIIVQHPFGSHSREQIRDIAARCVDEIAKLCDR
jgi:hypothetical protein